MSQHARGRHQAAFAPPPDQPYMEPWQPQGASPAPQRRRRRVFVYVFAAVQVLFLVWVIAGAAGGSDIHSQAVAYCHAHPDPYLPFAQCVSSYGGGAKAGTAVGVGLVVALWAVADIILGISYGVYRLARR